MTGLGNQLHKALSCLAHLFPLSANSSYLIAPVFQIHSRLQGLLLATLSLLFVLNPNRFLPAISSGALNRLSYIQSKTWTLDLCLWGIIHGVPCGLRQDAHLLGLINWGHLLLVQVNHIELNEMTFHLSVLRLPKWCHRGSSFVSFVLPFLLCVCKRTARKGPWLPQGSLYVPMRLHSG